MCVMSLPSSISWPLVMGSSPAISRSSVDLPQPEGPTKTMNSPLSISRFTPLMMWASPKLFWMLSSWRYAMGCLRSLLDGAEGQALHQLLLAEPAEDHDRRDGHQRSGRELGPEEALGARIGGDEHGERAGLGGTEV